MGDEGIALDGIRDIVLKPDTYNILKFRHNHTPTGEYILTAMFVPAYRIVKQFTDSRGWCNLKKAKEYYEKERQKKAEDPKALLIYKAEYCFTIEEALIRQGDNIFPREELTEQFANLEILKTGSPIETGSLIWETKKVDDNYINTAKWQKNPNGKILIKEHPYTDEFGMKFKNLYVGGIDSIDIGTGDSAQDSKASDSEKARLSDFCIVIKKRVFGQSEPEYVAMYKDRPKDPREAYENAAKLLTYYGCQAVLEATRTAIITYFRDKKYINLLMKRPRSTMPDVAKGNSNMLGAPATIKTIVHYRELIYDFILDYYHNLHFIEMVNQLLGYSDEKKKEFDIVAAMGKQICPVIW